MSTNLYFEETFEDVRALLVYWAVRFYGTYGGELGEWISDCHLIFSECYYSFDHSKGVTFQTWLTYNLRKKLYERIRNRQRESGRYNRKVIDKAKQHLLSTGKEVIDNRSSSSLEKTLQEISEDARTVVGLVIDAPFDLKLALAEKTRAVKFSDHFKNSLSEFLIDMGWDHGRILSSFKEITEALE